jgi:hypothetical protein
MAEVYKQNPKIKSESARINKLFEEARAQVKDIRDEIVDITTQRHSRRVAKNYCGHKVSFPARMFPRPQFITGSH